MKKLDVAETRKTTLSRSDLFFWLCHESNTSNPAAHSRCTENSALLEREIGEPVWKETEERLLTLRTALSSESKAAGSDLNKEHTRSDDRTTPSLKEEPQPGKDRTPTIQVKDATAGEPGGEQTEPVSAFIKATILDGAFVDPIVPHMLKQTNYPLAEKFLLVDKKRDFEGKYRARPQAPEQFSRAVENLLEQGIVDRVVEVDYSPDTVKEVMTAFFGSMGATIPTHATTSGGPIYPTLYGIWKASNDVVLQFDCDMLFYTPGEYSWVAHGLSIMEQDTSVAMMMAHPGPPAGPAGSSMSRRNRSRCSFDSAFPSVN